MKLNILMMLYRRAIGVWVFLRCISISRASLVYDVAGLGLAFFRALIHDEFTVLHQDGQAYLRFDSSAVLWSANN